MAFPKISIVTPSLNQGEYIEQTITSVLNQNYPNLEYIIIDGGSKDNTLEIIKKYEKHLSFWVSEKDYGQSDAINKGIKRATGEIFNWLNADDYYEPGALHKVAENFKDKNTNVVAGRSIVFKNENDFIRYSGTQIYKLNIAKSIGTARIDQPETFFRKSCIDMMGYLSSNLHYTMDTEWWIKYLLIFGTSQIKNIDDILVHFRHHEKSKTGHSVDKFKVERDLIYYSIAKQLNLHKQSSAIERLTEVNSKYNFDFPFNSNKELLKSAIQYFLLLRGNEFYFFHDKEEAKKCFDAIELNYLDSENRVFFKKINFKNNYLPTWLIKFLRKS